MLDQADPDTLALAAGARVTDTFAYTVLNGPVGPTGASLGNEATANIAIHIRLPDGAAVPDVDEAPVAGTPVDASLAEDVAVGTVVGTVSATDPEGADLTYALTTGVPFAVDPDTGAITTTAALDHETAASYALAFTASDGPTPRRLAHRHRHRRGRGAGAGASR